MPLEKLPTSMIKGTVPVIDEAARYDAMLLAFRNQMLSGRVFDGMVQGMSDAFEDESGISGDKLYDADENSLVTSNVITTPSGSGTWSAPAGHLNSVSGDDIQFTGAGSIYWTDPIEGDFDIQFTATALVGNTQYFGVFEADALGGANFGSAQPVSAPDYYHYLYYNHIYFNVNTTPGNVGGATGGNASFTVRCERRGSTYTWYQNGTLKCTLTDHPTGPVHLFTGFDGNTYWVYNISVTTYPVVNLNVISVPQTADTAPTSAQIALWEEDVDSVTLNTDIQAFASSDDGATWDQVTLSELTNLGAGRLLGGTVPLTGGGTDMRWKVATANGKELKLHATGMLWG